MRALHSWRMGSHTTDVGFHGARELPRAQSLLRSSLHRHRQAFLRAQRHILKPPPSGSPMNAVIVYVSASLLKPTHANPPTLERTLSHPLFPPCIAIVAIGCRQDRVPWASHLPRPLCAHAQVCLPVLHLFLYTAHTHTHTSCNTISLALSPSASPAKILVLLFASSIPIDRPFLIVNGYRF